MDNAFTQLAALIQGPGSDAALDFLRQWLDEGATIEAHTSGSTGAPKKIYLPKSDMERSARATCSFFCINAGEWLHLPLSVDYIAGKMMVVRAVVSGARLWVDNPSRHVFTSPPGDDPIVLSAIVPAQVAALSIWPAVRRVRHVIVGGAPISAAQSALLASCRPMQAWATYGMTETSSHVALRSITRNENEFRALPEIKFSTTGEGCLVIEAENYSFKRLITRDIVELHGNDTFKWLGRADNVINSGGVKIHPEVVETMIAQAIPEGMCYYIAARPSELWGSEAVLHIECPRGRMIDVGEILESVKKIVPVMHAPRDIVVHDCFERTSSGKIIRN